MAQKDFLVSRTSQVHQIREYLGPRNAVTVTPETKAVDAVIQFCQHPDINTLAVVDEDTKLLGILEIGHLIDDLLADVLPEGYMRSSINRDKMMEASFFLTVHETVEEMMTEPVAITYAYTAEEAFLVLHSNQLRGVPILDENDCVVSYLGLLEFLTLWMPEK